MRRAALLWLAAGALACGRGHRPASRPPLAFGPAEAVKAAPLRPFRIASELTLLDAGREPRRALRYHPSAGTVERLVTTRKTQSPVLSLLSTSSTVTTQVQVNKVGPDGTLGVTEQVVMKDFGGAGLPQRTEQKQRRLVGATRPFVNHLALDARGHWLGTSSPMAASSELHSPPFPAEPIGLGARWRTARDELIQGLTVRVDSTYELVAWDGEHVTLREQDRNVVPRQVVGGKLEVGPGQGGSEGKIELDLARLLPLSYRAHQHMEMSIRSDAMGEMKLSVVGEVTARQP